MSAPGAGEDAREPGAALPRGTPASRRLAVLLTVGLALAPFVGRAVVSADAAEVIGDTLGLFVTGRLSAPTMPPAFPHPAVPPPPPFHSHYGFYPSAFLVPFCAAPWALRSWLGAAGTDALIALTWTLGAGLAAWGFLRLARALRPDASPFLAPAFLAGTFVWPYAADSFFETFAAFGLALAAREVLAGRGEGRFRASLPAAAAFAFAAALKPVLWVTAPVLVAAAAVRDRRRGDGAGRTLGFVGLMAAGLAAATLPNLLVYGGGGNFGYGSEVYHFDTPLLDGLYGLLLSPGRGVVLYAPIVVLSVAAFRRLSPEARLTCLALPIVLACVAGRWHGWNGGSAWGPRYLLPVLPLLAAPAALLPGRAVLAASLLGAVLNLPGVLVAPGAWITYVETLKPPAGVRWPASGADAVSTEVRLAPLYGHTWLLARSAGVGLPAPWIASGARETAPPPAAVAYLSPLALRLALGLPPVPPILSGVLARIGVSGELRGRRDLAILFLTEAVRLDPGNSRARAVLDELERAGPARR